MSNNQGIKKYKIYYGDDNQLGGKVEKKAKKESTNKSSSSDDIIADITFIWKYRIEDEKELQKGKETDTKIFKNFDEANKWVNDKKQIDKLMKTYLKELADIKKSGKDIVFNVSHTNIRIKKNYEKPSSIMDASELPDVSSDTSDSDMM